VPYNGYAYVIRYDSGVLVAHPELDSDPTLLRKILGRVLLKTENSTASITTLFRQAQQRGERLVSGEVEMDGIQQVFTGCRLPKLNAIVAIHQSVSSIQESIESLIKPMAQLCYVLTAFVLLGTSLITVYLLGRYEDNLTQTNASLEREVSERTRSLLRTRNAVVFGLARLAESRDRDTGKHLESIRSYVTILASELAKHHQEIDHHYVADLAVASSLHDIGKVGIPDAVLLKPSQFSDAERNAMQMHTELGSECLSAIQKQLGDDDFLQRAQEIAIGHHEHWDGSGYPHGLQRNEIPLAARIVALADVYDALTSSRPYKETMSHAEARQWIVSQYETQFDPEVVEAFVAREQDFARISASNVVEQPADGQPSANSTEKMSLSLDEILTNR